MKKLAFLTSHPIPYQTPLFRGIAELGGKIDLTVYFCWDFGIKPTYEPDFGKVIEWDTPLLEGYNYKFLKNFSSSPSSSHFFGLVNPGVIKELWNGEYDAVLINGYMSVTNWLAFLGAWLSSTPIIFRGETDLLTSRSPLKRAVKRILFVPLFKTFSAFLYSCQSNKEYYRHYGVPDEKLFFFPCAVDNDYWQKYVRKFRGKKNEFKKKLDIPSKNRVIIQAGKMMALKRHMDLLKAYEKLKNLKIEKFKNITLIFVGDGMLRPELEKYVRAHNLENIIFAGFKNQSELPFFYITADIFVLPSDWDRSPKMLNEAMNFSLPVITTDRVGTAPDLIKNGENGFIYEVGNIDALAGHLKTLIEDSSMIKKMGKNSFDRIKDWSFENEIKGILSAFDYVNRILK